MMATNNYLLVPVDFTPESIHALHYAEVIASRLDVGITVAHIHQPLFDPVTGSAYDEEIMRNNRKKLEEMLLEVGWDQYRTKKNIPVNTHFDVGDVASHVMKLVEDPRFSCVIMSSHPESSFVKRVFGSVSTSIGRQSLKPVIVVPHHTPLKFPENIIVGISEELLHDETLQFLLEFIERDNAVLDFVHVTSDDNDYHVLKAALTDQLNALHMKSDRYHMTSIPVRGVKTDEALMHFTTEQHADLLVLTTHQRNFLDNLGHRSITKKVLSHPVVPVMILHSPNDEGMGVFDYLYEVIKEG